MHYIIVFRLVISGVSHYVMRNHHGEHESYNHVTTCLDNVNDQHCTVHTRIHYAAVPEQSK